MHEKLKNLFSLCYLREFWYFKDDNAESNSKAAEKGNKNLQFVTEYILRNDKFSNSRLKDCNKLYSAIHK